MTDLQQNDTIKFYVKGVSKVFKIFEDSNLHNV